MVHDVPGNPDTESTYECLRCGNIVRSETHPTDCAECGGGFRNRAMAPE